MDEQQTQVQTVSVSKTKMAVAVGLLGLSALAAGFAGLRAGTTKADLFIAKTTSAKESDMNKFSITIENKGSATVSSPFVVHIQLGDGQNAVYSLKVMNPPSDTIRGSYENIESKDGEFDVLVKNFKLKRGQSTTLTYWFVIPSEYESESLTFDHTLDSTNLVSESNEDNNRYKGTYDIKQMELVRETTQATQDTVTAPMTTSTPTSTPPIEQLQQLEPPPVIEKLPDLIIKDFTVTSSTYPGQKHFNVVIKNIGDATANKISMSSLHGTFQVQLYFVREDGTTVSADKFLQSDTFYTAWSLLPNQELTISKDLPISFGNYTKIKMKVDWLEGSVTSIIPFLYPEKGYILESNEDNNEFTKAI